jgi:hypothetical protein
MEQFCQERIAYFPLIRRGTIRKRPNNSSLPRERVYRASALQRKRDTHTDPQTLLR